MTQVGPVTQAGTVNRVGRSCDPGKQVLGLWQVARMTRLDVVNRVCCFLARVGRSWDPGRSDESGR